MKDREVTRTKCFLCGETARKKVRWFSVNPKSNLCLAFCPEHGYFKGKIRMKRTDEGKYYVIKTLKLIDLEEAAAIREKKELLRKKRRMKRHQEKEEKTERGGKTSLYGSTSKSKRK